MHTVGMQRQCKLSAFDSSGGSALPSPPLPQPHQDPKVPRGGPADSAQPDRRRQPWRVAPWHAAPCRPQFRPPAAGQHTAANHECAARVSGCTPLFAPPVNPAGTHARRGCATAGKPALPPRPRRPGAATPPGSPALRPWPHVSGPFLLAAVTCARPAAGCVRSSVLPPFPRHLPCFTQYCFFTLVHSVHSPRLDGDALPAAPASTRRAPHRSLPPAPRRANAVHGQE